MKDAVKITVIATGFREVPRTHHRSPDVHHSFSSHDDDMNFSVSASAPSIFSEPIPEMMMEEQSIEQSSPVAVSHASAEVISLETMRSALVANFEQEDLDVPAFLRKRNEVM
jgi:hypothetical protein